MPMHSDRQWQISDVPTFSELADKLKSMSWTCCTGFVCGELIVVNDSTGPPTAAQEYSILEFRGLTESDLDEPVSAKFVAGEYDKVEVGKWESMTVSWMDREDILSLLEKCNERIGSEEEPRSVYEQDANVGFLTAEGCFVPSWEYSVRFDVSEREMELRKTGAKYIPKVMSEGMMKQWEIGFNHIAEVVHNGRND